MTNVKRGRTSNLYSPAKPMMSSPTGHHLTVAPGDGFGSRKFMIPGSTSSNIGTAAGIKSQSTASAVGGSESAAEIVKEIYRTA